MKLVELKCKNCGAVLKVEPDSTDVYCKHCKTNYKFDDEAKHIKYDDMEKAGYDYEKGRIKAKKEHEEEKRHQQIEAQQAAIKAEKTAKMKKWKILGLALLWIYFLPFMATYYVWKKTKLSKKAKTIITVALWAFVMLFYIIALITPTDTQTNLGIDNESNSETESQSADNKQATDEYRPVDLDSAFTVTKDVAGLYCKKAAIERVDTVDVNMYDTSAINYRTEGVYDDEDNEAVDVYWTGKSTDGDSITTHCIISGSSDVFDDIQLHYFKSVKNGKIYEEGNQYITNSLRGKDGKSYNDIIVNLSN